MELGDTTPVCITHCHSLCLAGLLVWASALPSAVLSVWPSHWPLLCHHRYYLCGLLVGLCFAITGTVCVALLLASALPSAVLSVCLTSSLATALTSPVLSVCLASSLVSALQSPVLFACLLVGLCLCFLTLAPSVSVGLLNRSLSRLHHFDLTSPGLPFRAYPLASSASASALSLIHI